MQHFGVEATGLERSAHPRLELSAELVECRLRLLGELLPQTVAGPPLGDRLGLGLRLGDLLGGDPADQVLAELLVDADPGHVGVRVGRGLDWRCGNGMLRQEDPAAGHEVGRALRAHRHRPLRAAGGGDRPCGEHEIECGPIVGGHEVETERAGRVAGAANAGAEHGFVDRRYLVDRAIHRLGEEVLVHGEEHVGPAEARPHPLDEPRRLLRERESLERRGHAGEVVGGTGLGRLSQRGRERLEPLGEPVGTRAAGRIGCLGIAIGRLPHPHEVGHVEAGLGGAQAIDELPQRGGIGSGARGSLGLDRGPIEILPPIGAALAAGEQGVERLKGLAEIAGGGIEGGGGRWLEGRGGVGGLVGKLHEPVRGQLGGDR